MVYCCRGVGSGERNGNVDPSGWAKRQSQDSLSGHNALLLLLLLSFRLAFSHQAVAAGWPLEMKTALIGELLTVAWGLCSASHSLPESGGVGRSLSTVLYYIYTCRGLMERLVIRGIHQTRTHTIRDSDHVKSTQPPTRKVSSLEIESSYISN